MKIIYFLLLYFLAYFHISQFSSTVNQTDAIAYSERRRNIGPAVYNRSRLRKSQRRQNPRPQNLQQNSSMSPGLQDQIHNDIMGKFKIMFISIEPLFIYLLLNIYRC